MSEAQTQQVKASLDEGQWLRQRLGAPDWGAEEWAFLDGVLASYERMLKAFLEAKISLAMWEDLHWANPSTLELLGLVLEQTPTVPMLQVMH